MSRKLQIEPLQRWTEASPSEGGGLREALGHFATGVTVVATWADDGESRAFTANSFTSVSLDPPLVLVCLSLRSPSIGIFAQTDTFSISVLQASQREVSAAFASRDPVVKASAAKVLVHDEAPYVDRSLATFLCTRDSVVTAGDHVILIGRVKRFRTQYGSPLGFHRGAYVDIGTEKPKQSARSHKRDTPPRRRSGNAANNADDEQTHGVRQ